MISNLYFPMICGTLKIENKKMIFFKIQKIKDEPKTIQNVCMDRNQWVKRQTGNK